jgi:hypothetical protein
MRKLILTLTALASLTIASSAGDWLTDTSYRVGGNDALITRTYGELRALMGAPNKDARRAYYEIFSSQGDIFHCPPGYGVRVVDTDGRGVVEIQLYGYTGYIASNDLYTK